MSKRRVSFLYDDEIGNFYYSQGHPMKPHRVRMAYNLLSSYDVLKYMEVLNPPRASEKEFTRFHADEYIQYLKTISPENMQEHMTSVQRFNTVEDCPVFDGLWDFCQIQTGASIAGASRLCSGEADVAINWSGGLHHAKKAEASGFCYTNDCVLAILELLKVFDRVLYVDIDIHHGDGVEEAFYMTDRVMTVSFHKFGDYFPGTGDVGDIGVGKGKYYSLNFPLNDGIDDEMHREVFVPVISKVMEWYRPGAVVLQCGADSLSGDRLGSFNLSTKGHGACVDFFLKQNVPLILLGGGGYTIRNVARCWTYESSLAIGRELPIKLPYNEYFEFYAPDFQLHTVPSNMENLNTREYIEKVRSKLLENLRHTTFAPSVQLLREAPDIYKVPKPKEADPDSRESPEEAARRKTASNEFVDDDADNELMSGLPGARAKMMENAPKISAPLEELQKVIPTAVFPSLESQKHKTYKDMPVYIPETKAISEQKEAMEKMDIDTNGTANAAGGNPLDKAKSSSHPYELQSEGAGSVVAKAAIEHSAELKDQKPSEDAAKVPAAMDVDNGKAADQPKVKEEDAKMDVDG